MATGDKQIFLQFWIMYGTALIESVLGSLIGARILKRALADKDDLLVSIQTCLDEGAVLELFDRDIGLLSVDLAEDGGAFLEAGICGI
jgi:hypothetical protein